eukprot:TRINITY_DN12241_c0_g1_i1.p1 TRINITY_DN12241_c0_g1~~TRINITY_DN12241_c0_g1_i1.p1  ORF type:complete len:849 (-),score=183.85 TRINITY_DN12241_c0_g1_i1:76-2601(-)
MEVSSSGDAPTKGLPSRHQNKPTYRPKNISSVQDSDGTNFVVPKTNVDQKSEQIESVGDNNGSDQDSSKPKRRRFPRKAAHNTNAHLEPKEVSDVAVDRIADDPNVLYKCTCGLTLQGRQSKIEQIKEKHLGSEAHLRSLESMKIKNERKQQRQKPPSKAANKPQKSNVTPAEKSDAPAAAAPTAGGPSKTKIASAEQPNTGTNNHEDDDIEVLEEVEESSSDSESEDENEDKTATAENKEQTGKAKAEKKSLILCECGKKILDKPNSMENHQSGIRHQNYLANKALEAKWETNSTEIISKNDPMEAVCKQIEDYFKNLCPTEEEFERREACRRKLQSIVKSTWPDAQVHMFGSSATKIFSGSSDIDFCLLMGDAAVDELAVIKQLAKLVWKSGVRKMDTICILTARVPIFKLTYTGRVFEFKFDLCVNRPLGVHNSQLIASYCSLDNRMKPLIYVLKQICKNNKVLNSSHGLNSYCLNLMVIFFLQMRPEPVLPNLQAKAAENSRIVKDYNCFFEVPSGWVSKNKETLGQLLSNFFVFYTNFDFANQNICIRTASPVSKAASIFKTDAIVVEDPFEIDFNVSRLVKKKYLDIMRKTFQRSFMQMHTTQDISSLIAEPKAKAKKARNTQYRTAQEGDQQGTPHYSNYRGGYRDNYDYGGRGGYGNYSDRGNYGDRGRGGYGNYSDRGGYGDRGRGGYNNYSDRGRGGYSNYSDRGGYNNRGASGYRGGHDDRSYNNYGGNDQNYGGGRGTYNHRGNSNYRGRGGYEGGQNANNAQNSGPSDRQTNSRQNDGQFDNRPPQRQYYQQDYVPRGRGNSDSQRGRSFQARPRGTPNNQPNSSGGQ